MEVQVKQEDTDSEGDRLPTICDVFSIKREESLTENVLVVDGSYRSTRSDVLKYEEIKIEPFDVLSTKREHSPIQDIPVGTNNLTTRTDVLEYEEIKIEEFDVDKARSERERAASSQPVCAGQVMSKYLTIFCYDHLYYIRFLNFSLFPA